MVILAIAWPEIMILRSLKQTAVAAPQPLVHQSVNLQALHFIMMVILITMEQMTNQLYRVLLLQVLCHQAEIVMIMIPAEIRARRKSVTELIIIVMGILMKA